MSVDAGRSMTLSGTDLAAYKRSQALARNALTAIRPEIRPGATEASLVEACRRLMDAAGATAYWWYGTPAYILAGNALRASVEGDVYHPRDVPLRENDMVTIDLAPEVDGYWGDCARSYFLRNGELVDAEAAGAEQAEGMATEAALHALLRETAKPMMTFRELHGVIADELARRGYENLDFLGNFGHSIGGDVRRRAFMDAECGEQLDSVPLFTFEPHIARPASPLAFKFEEVYLFDESGRLQIL
jgi:Xaa-Pro aminopeptidase